MPSTFCSASVASVSGQSSSATFGGGSAPSISPYAATARVNAILSRSPIRADLHEPTALGELDQERLDVVGDRSDVDRERGCERGRDLVRRRGRLEHVPDRGRGAIEGVDTFAVAAGEQNLIGEGSGEHAVSSGEPRHSRTTFFRWRWPN